ncbi:MAG: ScpA family protein [Synergistota bacterium]|nr:ScpA family protein [Synergistota bacterium]
MIRIDIDGFSGPLDLLCHMVESREIEASSVSVAEVVRIYGAYHSRKGEVPIEAVAHFLVQAARLILDKALALMPQKVTDDTDEVWDQEFVEESTDIEDMLLRYRPYRKAAGLLAERLAETGRRSFRSSLPLPPSYDIGDLYSLSSIWWCLMKSREMVFSDPEDTWEDDHLAGMPAPIPEENQVENRMGLIMEELGDGRIYLSTFLIDRPGASELVVTILALLELSRGNRISLRQEDQFGDVLVLSRR